MSGESLSGLRAGVAQLARVSAFQAEGCGFETRLPLQILVGPCSSVVEHTLGKGEVVGSAPITGSISGDGDRVLR